MRLCYICNFRRGYAMEVLSFFLKTLLIFQDGIADVIESAPWLLSLFKIEKTFPQLMNSLTDTPYVKLLEISEYTIFDKMLEFLVVCLIVEIIKKIIESFINFFFGIKFNKLRYGRDIKNLIHTALAVLVDTIYLFVAVQIKNFLYIPLYDIVVKDYALNSVTKNVLSYIILFILMYANVVVVSDNKFRWSPSDMIKVCIKVLCEILNLYLITASLSFIIYAYSTYRIFGTALAIIAFLVSLALKRNELFLEAKVENESDIVADRFVGIDYKALVAMIFVYFAMISAPIMSNAYKVEIDGTLYYILEEIPFIGEIISEIPIYVYATANTAEFVLDLGKTFILSVLVGVICGNIPMLGPNIRGESLIGIMISLSIWMYAVIIPLVLPLIIFVLFITLSYIRHKMFSGIILILTMLAVILYYLMPKIRNIIIQSIIFTLIITASYSVLSFWNNWIYVFVEHPLFISVVDWILIIIMICLDKHKKVR